MAKANTPGRKQASDASNTADMAPLVVPKAVPTAATKKNNRTGGKGNRPQIGGTAVAGAKSTQPKPVSTSNNPQQQEAESYNRTMRRRMQQMNGPANDETKVAKTPREKRKERLDRLKQRRQTQLASLKKTMPGGRISTDTRRVYFLIAGVAAAIILLIVIFIILRAIGVIH